MSVDTMMKELMSVVLGKLSLSFMKNGAFVQLFELVTYQVLRGKNDTEFKKFGQHFTSSQMLIDFLMDEIQLLVLEEKRLEKPKKDWYCTFFAISDFKISAGSNLTQDR